MADLELAIDRLALTFENGGGHAHRAQPISQRALALLQTYVQQRLVEWGISGAIDLERLTVPPVTMDLSLAGNEEAANRLAEAIYGAIAAQLRV